ncbi:hypothetical protein [Streptomyces sp. Ru72]|uniref:hypothetical protein n=1 Tax=Streptomyces sp. Ru72 TaxID=2080747 RepID=UPI0011B087E1|nr:hypothetical protein [Streptomyces sp. Ru72]
MSRSRRGARGGRPAAGLLAALVLLLTGCSGGGADTGDTAAGPSVSAATSVTGAPAPAATAPSASPTPPYPTGSAGCHPGDGWTQKETADWVRLESETPDTFTPAAGSVRLRTSLLGYDGPLCAPVTVQVQFWKLTYGSTGKRDVVPRPTESGPDYYFSMRSLGRTQVRFDGTAEKSVPVPKSLYDDNRTVCEGALLAVYVGKPLLDRELPKEIRIGGSLSDYDPLLGDHVPFRTERIAEQQLSPPTAPQVCGPDGTPTADPSRTPGLTDPLDPTDRPSFDLGDLMPATP